MNKSKAKGTAAESAVVSYLKPILAKAGRWVARRTLNGRHDRGDIEGIPGVVIEVKNCATMQLGEWVDEANREAANDGASIGVVWHKRRGKGSPGDWYVTMDGRTFADLLLAVDHARAAA